MPRWSVLFLTLLCFATVMIGISAAEDSATTPTPTPAPAPTPGASHTPSQEELLRRIDELEQRLSTLERERHSGEERVRSLPWEPNREGYALSNGWYFTFHGEFRSRALVEANTANAYTNFAGERIYAYNPRSTFNNDYGWWDERLQVRTLMNFGRYADLIVMMQLGDIVWGSEAPIMGDHGDSKFAQTTLFFRELYTRLTMYPIPLYLVFGRMPVDLGNRIIFGLEHDGAYTYFHHEYFEIAAGAVRQYEGENLEMSMRTNDDEDIFFGWVNITPTRKQKVSLFGYCDDLKVTQFPNHPDTFSPVYLLPNFTQAAYTGQDSQLWDVGGNWVGQFGPITVNAEFDHEFGTLFANTHNTPVADDIHFHGFAAFLKTDWHVTDADTLALTMGYGSGDDPKTTDYEGFFAPYNDFGIRDDYMDEYIQRGYFSVYEHLAPGAGVPGQLFKNLGSGGIENTIFANLGADMNFLPNHHFYTSWGYIRAAQPNPNTHDANIGWELDARVDYLFSNNVVFSIYGGHLFMTGQYFRPHAHDAAQVFFEWKLRW